MSNTTFRKAGKYVIVCLNGKINEEININLHTSRLYEMLSSTFTNKSAISSATSEIWDASYGTRPYQVTNAECQRG